MKLTIGMASFNNLQEVVFTIQSLRMYQDLTDTELLVVDNFGDDALKQIIASWFGDGVRYVRYTEKKGTSAPRNKVFEEARGEWVICVDSHVFLAPGVVARFRAWADAHPGCKDLLQGPMLYDDLKTSAERWDDVWAGQMWGLWHAGNVSSEAEPFEIPMLGLGLFGCRKDAWLGFNAAFRGFGGEEGYIHAKYRKAGRKTLCVPFLKWWHYFHTRNGKTTAPYAPILEDRVRNYLIGFREVGLDLTPVLKHFNVAARKPVTNVQIDPNGACGSKCWFCPVRYERRPPAQVMPIDVFTRILDSVAEAVVKGSVAPNYTLWLSSYNDILVDPLVERRLQALRERKLKFVVLSNGVGLLKHHALLHEYRDVAHCYSFDIAAGNPESYAKHTLNPPETFHRIILGLRALRVHDPAYYDRVVHIGVNGAHDAQRARGQVKYDLPAGDTDRQVAQLKALLPYPRIEAMRPLCDRAGHLSEFAIDNGIFRPGTTGCNRLTEWLHVNSFGKAYSCCQDYAEEYQFADLTTTSVHDALAQSREASWRTIEGLCVRCTFAQGE